jgi:peptidoglycan hydrolase-like protein with peptidoglycan-binding domain
LGEGEYIVSVVAPTLLDGANGIAVKRLQGLLAAQGYELAIDGDYGPVTESAVKDFQHHVSIEEDGITGPETLTALMTKG